MRNRKRDANRHSLAIRTLAAAAAILASPAGAKDAGVEPRPFAVVELFTSEGCSSCPPAERLLNEIVADARENGRRVFPLAFHVDYWNRLGWTDPYSDPQYTQRQRRYANAFNHRSVYTPQMIVNGEAEFVGSDRAEARRAIAVALEQTAKITVSLSFNDDPNKRAETEQIDLGYVVSDNIKNAVLQIAVVERGLVTDVPRGENAGRKLKHDNVVRVFRTIPLADSLEGSTTLPLPESLEPRHITVIGYVQDPETMTILSATALDME